MTLIYRHTYYENIHSLFSERKKHDRPWWPLIADLHLSPNLIGHILSTRCFGCSHITATTETAETATFYFFIFFIKNIHKLSLNLIPTKMSLNSLKCFNKIDHYNSPKALQSCCCFRHTFCINVFKKKID